MAADTTSTTGSKVMFWLGWVLSVPPILLLLMSAVMKLMGADVAVKSLPTLGWDDHLLLDLGVVELASTVINAIPQTAVLGAILLTGYLGGAIATHVRIGEDYSTPLVLGVVIWSALWLRDARVRAIVPFKI